MSTPNWNTTISVLLPAYNEEEYLEDAVMAVQDWLDRRDIDYEIIIIEDGCTDTTPAIAAQLADQHASIRHLHYADRLGKGQAPIPRTS